MLELTLRLIASLGLVVGLLLVIVRIGGRRFQGRTDAPVRVVHRQALSRTSSVAVIEVGGRMLVVGTTDQQVSMLTELDPESFEPTDLDADGELAEPVVEEQPAPGFTPLERPVIQPVSRPLAAGAGAGAGSFDGAAFAAHLDSAVRDLRVVRPITPSTPVPAPVELVQPVRSAPVGALPSIALAALEAEDLPVAQPRRVQAPAPQAPVAPVAAPAPAGSRRGGAHAAPKPSRKAERTRKDKPSRRAARSGGRRVAEPIAQPAPQEATGPLAGSVLSPATWKQAAAATRGRR